MLPMQTNRILKSGSFISIFVWFGAAGQMRRANTTAAEEPWPTVQHHARKSRLD
jgi:hypothetical protein